MEAEYVEVEGQCKVATERLEAVEKRSQRLEEELDLLSEQLTECRSRSLARFLTPRRGVLARDSKRA